MTKIRISPSNIDPAEFLENIRNIRTGRTEFELAKQPDPGILYAGRSYIPDPYFANNGFDELFNLQRNALSRRMLSTIEAFYGVDTVAGDKPVPPAQRVLPKASVKQIHDELRQSSDNILIQAEKILAEASDQDVNELLELESLGFGNMKELKNNKLDFGAYKTAVRNKQRIEAYRVASPQYIFVLESEIKRICMKYGLLSGDVQRFTGEIPKENRQEILSFSKSYPNFNNYRLGMIATKDQFEFRHNGLHNDEVQEYMIVDKDPIVTYVVEGTPYSTSPESWGRLIVSMWGDEAEIIKKEGLA